MSILKGGEGGVQLGEIGSDDVVGNGDDSLLNVVCFFILMMMQMVMMIRKVMQVMDVTKKKLKVGYHSLGNWLQI